LVRKGGARGWRIKRGGHPLLLDTSNRRKRNKEDIPQRILGMGDTHWAKKKIWDGERKGKGEGHSS